MYEVIKHFVDLQDNGYSYEVGDEFPRRGKIVSDERLNELVSNQNKRGVPLIKKVGKTDDHKIENVKDEEKDEEKVEETEAPKPKKTSRKKSS